MYTLLILLIIFFLMPPICKYLDQSTSSFVYCFAEDALLISCCNKLFRLINILMANCLQVPEIKK